MNTNIEQQKHDTRGIKLPETKTLWELILQHKCCGRRRELKVIKGKETIYVDLGKTLDDEFVGEFFAIRTTDRENNATMKSKMMLRDVTIGGVTYKVYIPCAENKKDMKDGDECILFKEKEHTTAVGKPVTFDLGDPIAKKARDT